MQKKTPAIPSSSLVMTLAGVLFQLLDGAEIDTGHYQPRGKGMAQDVRTEVADPGPQAGLAKRPGKPDWLPGLAVARHKDGGGSVSGSQGVVKDRSESRRDG